MPDPSNPPNVHGPQPGQSIPIPPDAVAVIFITMNAAGEINVAGSIEQKMASIAMLEIAKHSVFKYHDDAESRGKNRVLTPPPGFALPPGFKR